MKTYPQLHEQFTAVKAPCQIDISSVSELWLWPEKAMTFGYLERNFVDVPLSCPFPHRSPFTSHVAFTVSFGISCCT